MMNSVANRLKGRHFTSIDYVDRVINSLDENGE